MSAAPVCTAGKLKGARQLSREQEGTNLGSPCCNMRGKAGSDLCTRTLLQASVW